MPGSGRYGENAYMDQFALRIPNDVRLLGVDVFQQWITFESHCFTSCSYWIGSSNAGKATIGL